MTGSECRPITEPGALDLGALPSGDLEQILIELLVVKYPGIEQSDVERFFQAIEGGNVEQVGRVEADMALKSAQWKLAALDLQE